MDANMTPPTSEAVPTFKFTCQGEILRKRPAEFSLAEIEGAVVELFSQVLPHGFIVKYQDDEGDSCTLTAQTFVDFAKTSQGKAVLKLEVVPKHPADIRKDPCPPTSGMASEAAAADVPPVSSCGIPPLFATLLQGLDPNLIMGGACIPDLAQFAPLVLQHLSAHQADVDKFATAHKEAVLPVLQALHQSLEPFEQFQQTKHLLDPLLSSTSFDGLGVALTSFLETLCNMVPEERRNVGELVLGPAVEKMKQLMCGWIQTEIAGAPAGKGWGKAHCGKGAWAKGWGKSHAWGHAFPWGKGWGKGWGKCWGNTEDTSAKDAKQAESEKVAPAMHVGVTCDGCGACPIFGSRFKCKVRPDYDLCSDCHAKKSDDHEFECLATPVYHHWRPKGWGKGHKHAWWHGADHHWGQSHPYGKARGKGWCHTEDCSLSSSEASSSSSGSTACSPKKLKKHAKQARWQQRREMKEQKKVAKQAMKKRCKEAKERCKEEIHAAKQALKQTKKEIKWSTKAAKHQQGSGGPGDAEVLGDMGFTNAELNAHLLAENNGSLEATILALIAMKA